MLSFVQFFTLERQFILFIAALAGAITCFSLWGITSGLFWLSLIIVVFLVVKYIILGTINSALMKMQMGEFEAAEKTLSYTRFPQWLRFGYHGVFYMLKSQLTFQRGDHNAAESYAEKALSLDLQDDMKAGLYLELINIHGSRQNIPKVKEYFAKGKKLNITIPQLKEKYKEIELMLEGKHPQQLQMQQKSRHSPYSQAPSFMKRGRK